MNKYFVSYHWKTLFRHGVGMATLETKEPMETESGLMDVREAIMKRNRFRSLVILNFIKMGEADD